MDKGKAGSLATAGQWYNVAYKHNTCFDLC